MGGWTGQTHFMVGPGRGPTKNIVVSEDIGLSSQEQLNKCQS